MTEGSGWRGTWWVPDRPDDQTHGELTWQGRARLELHAGLAPLLGPIPGDPLRYSVLHGLASDGQPITLLGGVSVSRPLTFAPRLGVSAEVIAADCLILGAHLDGDSRFEEVCFEVPGLEHWLPQAALIHELEHAGAAWRLTYVVSAPPDEVVHFEDGTTLAWQVHRHASAGHLPLATIRTAAWAAVRRPTPEPLEAYLARWQRVATLLTFAWGASVAAGRLSAKSGDRTLQIHVGLNEADACKHTEPHAFFLPKTAAAFEFDAVL